MKVVFVGDNLSIHQRALCDELYRATNEQFFFISTKPITEERLNMGWKDYSSKKKYALIYTDENKAYVKKLIRDADAVILGAARIKFVSERLKKGGLVFKYQERPFKSGLRQFVNAKFLYSFLNTYILRQSDNYHLLAASAYCYDDLKKFHCFYNRAWKWGYFIDPICTEYVSRMNQKPQVIWVGRFLKWKHCEMAINAAKYLKEKKIAAEFLVIGSGEEQKSIVDLIIQNDVDDYVKLLGNMDNALVRSYMKNADVCLVTSDFNEGWGVVVNESLSSGCCVISSRGVGAAPYLIKENCNGLLFETLNQVDLNVKLEKAILDTDFRERLGRKAIDTMANEWSPQHAAESFVELIRFLKAEGKEIESGPCSRA